MKILFISRAYPPIVGGIENQNYALSVWLKKVTPTDTIANPYGKKALLIFFPYVLVRVLLSMRRYDVLLLGDGVLSLVGAIVKFFYPKKTVVSIVHGLDLTYKSALYQNAWVKRFLPSLDGIIAVSEETKKVALQKGLSPDRVFVVHNGVETESFSGNYSHEDALKILGPDSVKKTILLTTGRLAKRKGAEWFIRSVLPLLPSDTVYVLAGSGPEEQNIRQAIADTHLENRVYLLGRVTDEVRNLLLNTADIFVQPNIPVPGDMEGFGIAVIEAAACGRVVIASELEGLKDALTHNENGILVPTMDATAYVAALQPFLQDPAKRQSFGLHAKAFTESHFHWRIIAQKYMDTLKNIHH